MFKNTQEQEKCGSPAPEWKDGTWGDITSGQRCTMPKGHKGHHCGPNGANGMHSWDNEMEYRPTKGWRS